MAKKSTLAATAGNPLPDNSNFITASERCAADAERDVRGFALIFHREKQLRSHRQYFLDVILVPYGTT